MRERPYDPSWRALLLPSAASDFFADGRPASEWALCAELARVAYIGFERSPGEEARARDVLHRAGFANVSFLSAGGTECVVARDDAERLTVVAFRGTAGVRDILTDLMIWRVAWTPGGRVHAGFACALRRVWPDLLPTLTRDHGRLVYTGHSLGAAIATLAATLLPPAALYTFGSPRVGNAAFAGLLEPLRFVRTTGCADLVCDVPPAWLGFAHAGSENYVDRNGVSRGRLETPARNSDRRLARREYFRRLAWRPGNVFARRLADHAPVNYVSAGAGDAPLTIVGR